MTIKNGDFFADERENYLYGESEVIPLEEVKVKVSNLIEDMKKKAGEETGPLC